MRGLLRLRLLLTILTTTSRFPPTSSLEIEKAHGRGLSLQVDEDGAGKPPVTFPIHRRKPPRPQKEARSFTRPSQTFWRDINRGEYLLSRAQTVHSSENPKKWRRAGWETMAMSSFDVDSFYYSTIQVGTPAQSLDVLLDTGAAYLWLQSVGCSPCNNPLVQPQYDGSLGGFNGSRSSTFIGPTDMDFGNVANFDNLTYFDGSWVAGSYVKDTVKLGEFSVMQQTFLLSTSVSDEWGIAGLLGLSRPYDTDINASYKGDLWWISALSQFEKPEMSFFFTEWRGYDGETIMPGGQFTLGGRNASLYDGEVAFVPTSRNQSYWTIPIFSFSRSGGRGVNKTVALPASQKFGMVDTGTTLILGPTDAVDSFFMGAPGAIRGGAVNSLLNDTWLLPCNTTLTAQFVFGSNSSSVTVTIPSTNLLYKWWNITYLLPGYCVSSISAINTTNSPNYNASSGDPAWVLGDSFLKSTYTVFRSGDTDDYVGFAPLKGVNYTADGNVTIGFGGDGVDGNIGDAGVVIVHSGGSRLSLKGPWIWIMVLFGSLMWSF